MEHDSGSDDGGHHQVLIAINGSEESENAFDFYATNLHHPGNKLLLVHGAEFPPLTTSGMLWHGEATSMCEGVYDSLLDTEKRRVKELEMRYAEKMRAYNMTGKITAVFCGRPGELITEMAEKEQVTMIVMGTHNYGFLRRTIMGSVSDYVLHHAPCPVTVCRRPKGKKRTTSTSSTGSG
jgi:nucleotide-binding universal stress UspA family protein